MKITLTAAATLLGLALLPQTSLAADAKQLYKDAVAPVISSKCGACHGEKKQKGKLRLDTIAAMIKGGSEGTSLVPGKPEESSLLQRIHLPLDDDEHMPPESKTQLTEDEIAVLEFWVKSGAKENESIGSLNAPPEVTMSIVSVIATAPEAPAKAAAPEGMSDADKKLIADTMKKVNSEGGNLMAIAQNTPQLRFSALNVAKTFNDQNLQSLKPVGKHVLWLDLARTQITDEGLAALGSLNKVTRLNLEKTKITDAGLDHIKGLADLEYLNIYSTDITDAGIAKLASNKKLEKLYLWQTKTTGEGVAALAKAIPGIEINTGTVTAVKKPATKPVAAVAPAKKTAPAAPKPTPPAAKKPATTPSAITAPKGTPGSLETALKELTAAVEKAKKDTKSAQGTYNQAMKQAEAATKNADAMKAKLDQASDIEKKATEALQALMNAVEANRKK